MDGFSLHAGVSIEAHRRGKLEHLCRYIARPSISTDRLTLDERGRILYRLRHPYRDGTTHIVFTPTSFLERLCALIPRPCKHLLTYHGVLAPASSWRPEIIPAALSKASRALPDPRHGPRSSVVCAGRS